MYPSISKFDSNNLTNGADRVLIAAEGFEARSLALTSSLEKTKIFKNSIVIKNLPIRASRLDDLLEEIKPRTSNMVKIFNFNRYMPDPFEIKIRKYIQEELQGIDEIILDISVMSKILIIILFWELRKTDIPIRLIYTEPQNYSPTLDEFKSHQDNFRETGLAPSCGVHDVVRTSGLSSIVMQRSPAYVVAFTSFNEQLIRALLASINPTHLTILGSTAEHSMWRQHAAQKIHQDVITEFETDNPLIPNGLLKNSCSTIKYGETIEKLASIYKNVCYTYRLVLSPTGSKMQTVGCALFKICCPDVHIEYPTPESYLLSGYSSDEIKEIHEIYIPSISQTCITIAEKLQLNG